MCLSIPSRVLSIDENNYAIVETLGVKRGVSLDLIAEPVAVGEYVLIHTSAMENGEISVDDGDLGLNLMRNLDETKN